MMRASWSSLFTWTLITHAPQCAAQTTYPYTETDTVTVPFAATDNALYEAGFTVYGNVKTIAVAGHGDTPAIEVYQSTYAPAVPTSTVNEYTIVQSLTGKNTPGTDATSLGYAIEGGQSVKTSEIIVGTTIDDSAGGIYPAGAGAAYVFKQHSATAWSQTARLQPSDLADVGDDKFGASVGMDEFDPTRIMVGAPLASDSDTGAVYFYQSSPTATYWTQGQKLMPDNPVANSRFGDEIEMFGRFAAITQPETCEVYIFEQERPKPKPKPKPVSPCDKSSPPTPSPVISTWKPLVQHNTLRWSQQQVLNFTNSPYYNCDVGGRTNVFDGGNVNLTFGGGGAGMNDDDPGYGDGAGGGYGGYISLSMFEDTLAIGVPGYEDNRARDDYRDLNPDPSLCHQTCTYQMPNPGGGPCPVGPVTGDMPTTRDSCCPLSGTMCATYAPLIAGCSGTTNIVVTNGGPLHLGHCEDYPYAPGDNGIVYIYDMETFKGDCDRENYFPTVLSFDELVNLRDSDNDNNKDDDKDDDCHEHHHHKPKPKPQCEVSRWSMQSSLTSPSPEMNDGRNADCQNFGYNVNVYKDVVTVNEINTMSFDIGNPAALHEAYEDAGYGNPDLLLDEYHCMWNLYYDPTSPLPHYSTSHDTTQPLVKEGFVYAYEQTSGNTWSHIGNTVAGYEINTNTVASIEAVNTQVVGTEIFTLESSADSYTFDVQSTDNTWQCAVITLMDQFGDGWGGAELQITDSDGRKQTFAPYCDSPGIAAPHVYSFRWCPDDWQDGDEVKMEILHSPSTKFRWELEWSVFFEWNQQVLYGDWETEMTLSYDTIGSQVLRLKHAEHLINTTAACAQCDLYTAGPTSMPSSQPIAKPKPKPKTTAHSPTKSPSPSSHSHRALLTEQDHDTEDNSLDMLDMTSEEWEQLEEEEKEVEATHTHLRNLHHKKSVRTHSPTMSPAPTMVQAAFNTWEQIALTGGDISGSGDRFGWDEDYNELGYAAAHIPMRYFISDKNGKHLFYEGTKCVTTDVTCWNHLPAGDRDYILRVGGAATPAATTATEGWTFCGITGGRMEQLDFRVKDYITTTNLNSDECDALLKVDRATYCQNTLSLTVPVNGIIVLENLILDSFSQVDLELLGHAISLIFSPTTLLEVSFQKHMHSSRGAHVGFTVEVPSSTFDLDATDFDTMNSTAFNAFNLLKKADLGSSVDALLLSLSALGVESNLNSHGRVYVEDLSISDEAKATYVKNPFYYVDDDADNAEGSLDGDGDGTQTGAGDSDGSINITFSLLNVIQNHSFVFLVLMTAVVVYIRRRSSGDDDDDDIEAAAYHRSEQKKKASSLVNLPFSDGKKHRDERKNSSRKHKHRHGSGSDKKDKSRSAREEKEQSSTSNSSTLQARASALKSYVPKEVTDQKTAPGSSGSSGDRYSQRFVPYGNAADLAAEEGWAAGSQGTANTNTRSSTRSSTPMENAQKQKQEQEQRRRDEEEDEDEEEYGDELDNILSQFDSSSSSSGSSSGDSDGWHHA